METVLKVVVAVVLIGLCLVLTGAFRNVMVKAREQTSPGFKSATGWVILATIGFFALMFVVAIASRPSPATVGSQEVFIPRLKPEQPAPEPEIKIVSILNKGEFIELSNGKTYKLIPYPNAVERCSRWSIGDKVRVMGRYPTKISNGNEIIEVVTD